MSWKLAAACLVGRMGPHDEFRLTDRDQACGAFPPGSEVAIPLAEDDQAPYAWPAELAPGAG